MSEFDNPTIRAASAALGVIERRNERIAELEARLAEARSERELASLRAISATQQADALQARLAEKDAARVEERGHRTRLANRCVKLEEALREAERRLRPFENGTTWITDLHRYLGAVLSEDRGNEMSRPE